MYRALNENNLPLLEQSLNISYADHSYLTRNRNSIVLPFPRVEAVRESYRYQFLQVWNELPNEIKIANSLNKFKKLLKNYFLALY